MTTEPSVVDSDTNPGVHSRITFMFADIEGSTKLLEALGDEYPRLVFRARELLRGALAKHRGVELDAEGDSAFAAFSHGIDAIRAAIEIQKSFHAESWPSQASVRLRIGVHTGQAQKRAGKYFGLDVHRTARICAAARGGQTVFSNSTRADLGDEGVPPEIGIRELGSHRLKDLRYPEVLFDVCIPGLPTSFGALHSLDAQPNNLPPPTTTFIGRDVQRQEVCKVILSSETRLLTLTGTGGTGKTRLAIECARTLLDNFSHGVFLIPLASVTDPGLLASAIVQTLGLPQFGSKTPLESLCHHLFEHETLLVLDNFEQILDAATQVVELLQAAPRLKIVTTSREPLNVRLERQYAVWPLQVPRSSLVADIPALGKNEAVRLFTERVRDFDDTFELTSANADAVCGVCRRLDGLPLALELAASWLQFYTPLELLTRLERSMDFLAGGPKDLARHQQTLRDTITWSYKLLRESERVAFRRLSVFRGGFTIDSAAAVLSERAADGSVLVDLMSLVRKNLVVPGTVDGQKRLGMLETIRQFAMEELDAGSDALLTQRKHAVHYLHLAERMAPGLTGRAQRRSVTTLLDEQDNLRAALAWTIEHGEADLTSRLLRALLWLWIPRGQFSEGRAWATRALNEFADLADARQLGLMLEVAGWLEVLAGSYDVGRPLFERSHALFAKLDDRTDRARATVTLAVACLVLGDDRGAALADEALQLSQALNDKPLSALALLAAGIKCQMTGDSAGATSAYNDALHLFYQVDNVFWPGQLLQNLALLRLEADDCAGASALAIEAFEIGREHDYPMIRNLSLAVMGGIAFSKGDPTLAGRLFGAVDASLHDLGVRFEPPEHQAMQAQLDTIRAAIGTEAFATAFEEGRRWHEQDILAGVRVLQALCDQR